MNQSQSMSTEFKPIAASDRIQALDVIRGFALLGIFMMNVEFFNRPLGEIDLGLPTGGAGIDHWAGWFVYVFVRGKFWTMFSLLFGMGFAVMLGRAEQAGRAFVGPYVRRTLALAVFGALHAIFIWAGDILFSYAMGAVVLMIVFYTRPKVLLLIAGTCLGVAALFAVLSKVMAGSPPWQPFAIIALPLLVLCVVDASLRRWPLKGMRNAGLALYLVPFLMMTVGGFEQMKQPPEPERDRIAQVAADTPAKQEALTKQLKERAEKRQEHVAAVVEDERVMRGGTYAEAVKLRAQDFAGHMEMNLEFSIIVLGMFLLGAWFIRSGVMAHPEQHLPLFRKLAWIGLPLGLGLSLVSAGIVTTHVRGVNDSVFQIALGLMMLGNLPACLGYVGALVLLWHGRARALLAPLAPTGRMALTNYLSQSVIGTLFFYGYGLGHWGLGRAWQLVFVMVVFALQIAFSHWWLARFRYGPMEWLWRWATYGKRPAMRLATS
ncbi:DUF418 domain-containing protein [Thermomonas sp.]|uniref:DUF418 domain-containing protein n=1 Tax=Thermomonas sp. TaxID=1971895 RepID=UPI002488A9FC|nr:DUF418 domain-containing protein [Thermomonas sp.]MDI1253916.1 DUF418 domain-containing protein [Thermomonas sp.]